MTYLLIGYAAFGLLYGFHLSRRYSKGAGDTALILLMSAAVWPFLLCVERTH